MGKENQKAEQLDHVNDGHVWFLASPCTTQFDYKTRLNINPSQLWRQCGHRILL